MVSDLEQVLAHVKELAATCETYKEYQKLFELEVRMVWGRKVHRR